MTLIIFGVSSLLFIYLTVFTSLLENRIFYMFVTLCVWAAFVLLLTVYVNQGDCNKFFSYVEKYGITIFENKLE